MMRWMMESEWTTFDEGDGIPDCEVVGFLAGGLGRRWCGHVVYVVLKNLLSCSVLF